MTKEKKQDLLKQLEERMPTLSKSQRRIATYLLEHYDRAAYLTAAKLGEQVEISESTVVRFATELGYGGYPALQDALQELTRANLTAPQRMAVADHRFPEGDELSRILTDDAERIRLTLESIDRKAFTEAVERIVSARRIYIVGMRSSAALAGFLQFHLRMIFDHVCLVQTNSGSEMFEELMHLSKEDVLIAISFPRYSTSIVRAVEFARQVGAGIVSITDGPRSPIAPFADQVLTARSDMVSFADSLVAPLSVINALITAISRRKKDEIAARLTNLEPIWHQHGVYETRSSEEDP
jgi:DNA-binding MurR/RpiR family transcriptional regulator